MIRFALFVAVRVATTLALLSGLCVGLVAIVAGPVLAADLRSPEGAVVLTVAGNISAANRPGFDPRRDSFLKYHERKFDRAAQFDRAMLDELGSRKIRIEYAEWAEPVTFTGPRLVDVLRAAGWRGGSITTLALDGFGTKISRADIDAHDWVLATRANGRPMGIGQRGPLWLVFDPPGNRPATQEEEGQWPWAIFFIQAE